jgi:hypothetical protein
LAENAQEFIFVHIPKKKIWEITPSDKKNWPYHFFLRYYAYVIDHVMRTKSRPNHIFGHLILSFNK